MNEQPIEIGRNEQAKEAERKLAQQRGLLFYRCILCRNVVSSWDIKESHGCSKCGGTKVSPSNLTLWEKLVQVIKHPKVWAWNG